MQYHNTLDALVFDQTAAEDYALYIQCFALARHRLLLDIDVLVAAGASPSAYYLITDCDETILDNSAYNAWLLETGRDFHDDTWRAWCRDKQAKATPGAVEFIQFAAGLGVSICYVSSRFEDTRDATAENLRSLGFPLPDASPNPATSNLYLAGMMIGGVATKKGEQFAFLAQRFGRPPIVQLGDNLSDHDAARYSSKTRYTVRATNAEQDKARWGADWIAFPNSVYGGWRQSLRMMRASTDVVVADEDPPVPFQAAPVRPPVTPTEALKIAIVNRWVPSTPIP